MHVKSTQREGRGRRQACCLVLAVAWLVGCGSNDSPQPQAKKPEVHGARIYAPVAEQPAAPPETPTTPASTPAPAATPSPSPVPVATAPAQPVIVQGQDGFFHVNFNVLAGFNYKPSIDLLGDAGLAAAPAGHVPVAVPVKPRDKLPPTSKAPDAIQKLNKQNVRVEGFMIPEDYEDGGTNEFVLMAQIPGCRFCDPPKLNDWIIVKMKDGKRTPYVADDPVAVYGVLEVGELIQDGSVSSLYRMVGLRAEKMKLQ
jgi:hypothetical protein